MKSLILLTVVLPFCLTIEVKFFNTYGTGIKKIEIPSCSVEPCVLVKGTSLNVSVTVESRYPSEKVFDTVSDLESNININGYRNRYVYDLAPRELYCKTKQNRCPLHFNNLYKIDRQLFLSKDTEADQHTGFGTRNGIHRINVNVVMMAHGMVGTVIGDSNFSLNIKGSQ